MLAPVHSVEEVSLEFGTGFNRSRLDNVRRIGYPPLNPCTLRGSDLEGIAVILCKVDVSSNMVEAAILEST